MTLLSDHVLQIILDMDVLQFSTGETRASPNSSVLGDSDKNEKKTRYRQIYETLNQHSFNKNLPIKQITILEVFSHLKCFIKYTEAKQLPSWDSKWPKLGERSA